MGASNFLRKLIGGGGRSGIDRRTEDLLSLDGDSAALERRPENLGGCSKRPRRR